MAADAVKIVVIDGNQDFVEALALLLGMDGYLVKTAGDDVDARQLINDFRPSVVLADLNIDDDSRVTELVSEVRAQFGRAITLVALTAWSGSDERVVKVLEQFDGYLAKPVDIEQLRSVLPRSGAA